LQAAELAQASSNLFASRITAYTATNSLQALESSREKVAFMDWRSSGTSSPTQWWRYEVHVSSQVPRAAAVSNGFLGAGDQDSLRSKASGQFKLE
jgi:hypothetical protein